MTRQYDLIKGLSWISCLALFGQLLFLITQQALEGGAGKVLLGEAGLWKAFFYPVVIKAILFFLFVQALSYASLIFLVWGVCQRWKIHFKFSQKKIYWLGILFWLIVFFTLFLSNIIFFPNSFFSIWLTSNHHFYFSFFPVISFLWALLVVGLGVVFLESVFYFLYLGFKKQKRIKLIIIFFIVLIGFFIKTFHHEFSRQTRQPNIIIIGLDALRPDYLGINNSLHAGLTPHLDHFLKKAVIFDHTLTPLARTFPAWISILTGEHPKQHGARFNLDAPSLLNINFTIAKALRFQGYETWFATDETRFSNIDRDFGFDHLLKPPEGANDFLIGSLNDFPITNLFVNSWLGELCFPYSYANRAAYVTYHPSTFVNRIRQQLPEQAQLKKPMFLAMHLLLTHWPNEWANSQLSDLPVTARYEASLHAVDEQWAALMQVLEKKNLLNNAIVIVLSDHGEALGLRGDRVLQEETHQYGQDSIKQVEREPYVTTSPFSLKFATEYGIDTSYGHGTDVLSLSQYKTLMAWQARGDFVWQAKRVSWPVSLLDIAPTLTELFQLEKNPIFNGVSLKENLLSDKKNKMIRDFYIEDGYKIPALAAPRIDVEKVLMQTLHIYNIDSKTGKITMKPDVEKKSLSQKSYAIIHDHWLLASYPALLRNDNKKEDRRWYIVDLKTRAWSGDLHSAWAKQTPADILREKLIEFYGNEEIPEDDLLEKAGRL